MGGVLIFRLLILVIVFGIVGGIFVKNWRRRKVLDGSLKLAALRVLNKTTFYDVPSLSVNVRCYNKRSLYSIDLFLELVKDMVENNRADIVRVMIARIDENRKKHKKYIEDCQWIVCDDVFVRSDLKDAKIVVNMKDVDMDAWGNYHAKEWFLRMENELFKDNMVNPDLDFQITVRAVYDSPKGEVHLVRKEEFNSDDCMLALFCIEDKEERMKSKEYQRSLLRASLRYDVMKRDDFKCVICGASADDGVKLHVDHIKPISKGGKTEFDNLRTLCSECNLGKSDKYEDDSLN